MCSRCRFEQISLSLCIVLKFICKLNRQYKLLWQKMRLVLAHLHITAIVPKSFNAFWIRCKIILQIISCKDSSSVCHTIQYMNRYRYSFYGVTSLVVKLPKFDKVVKCCRNHYIGLDQRNLMNVGPKQSSRGSEVKLKGTPWHQPWVSCFAQECTHINADTDIEGPQIYRCLGRPRD